MEFSQNSNNLYRELPTRFYLSNPNEEQFQKIKEVID